MATKEEYKWTISRLEEKMNNGDASAMKSLGDLYFRGESGEGKNHSAAFPYWKAAVDHGEVSIAGMVGALMLTGKGCEMDEKGAIPYLIKGADNGDKMAQYQLGLCYETGIGCQENTWLATKYYRMAALQNMPDAQYRLGGLMFLSKESNSEYLHWLCCAHLNGVKDATAMLNDFIDNNPNFHETIEWQINKINESGIVPNVSSNRASKSEGCYVATAVYGSYDCPQVWTLRRFRDDNLASTWYGRVFIKAYYSISPTIVKYFGNSPVFQNFWRKKLDKFVRRLQDRGVEGTPYCDKKV